MRRNCESTLRQSRRCVYIRLTDSKVIDSEEVRPVIVLDYAAADRVVSLEIRSVSKQLPDADVGRMQLEVA